MFCAESGMHRFRSLARAIIATLCLINPAQGQDFLFTGAPGTQFLPNYRQSPNEYVNQDINPFRQASSPGYHQIDSYLPQRDLQTSDLPFHLQQTLPQYRITTKAPPFPFQFHNSPPAPFRSSQNVVPSTHRPNYSHLFSHAHHRNPSQTETFLGEITLQSPADLPPKFDDFKPSAFTVQSQNNNDDNNKQRFSGNVDQNLDITERPKISENTVQFGTRPTFLNHRSRIFAPDPSKTAEKTQVKNYFVNNNGDVFITTKIPFSPKPTSSSNPPTTVQRKNPFSSATKPTTQPLFFDIKSNRKPFIPNRPASTTPHNSFDLDSLLEEPIKSTELHSDDVVEVVKSIPKATSTASEEVSDEEPEKTTGQYEELTTDYEYDSIPTDGSAAEEGTHEESNNIQDEEYPQSDEIENEEEISSKINQTEKITNTSNYDILTIKPSSMVKDDNFREFIDTVEIDNTTEEPISETTTLTPTNNDSNLDNGENEEQYKSVEVEEEIEDEKKEPELVVSVVTTKSVVNNTIIATATPLPPVTEQMTPSMPTNDDNTTDSWVVIASVQTSRSVSGARYLPSSIVEQEERIKLLNEGSDEQEDRSSSNDEMDDTNSTSIEMETTTLSPIITKQKTSTESLIDKLDRVQSDLSSGLLTSGFKNEGNNIAVIRENMTDKIDATTMLDLDVTPTEASSFSSTKLTTTTTTTTKSPLPAVQIRKFSPHARPSSTTRPKKIFDTIKQDDLTGLLPPGFKPKYQNTRKTTTTTPIPVDINVPQGDEPSRETKNVTTGRSSGISNKTQVTVQDVSSFLPPGYKSDKKDDSSKLLEELLSKIKNQNKSSNNEIKNKTFIDNIKQDNISAFLPSGYKPHSENKTKFKSTNSNLFKNMKQDDISALLPSGYKSFKTSTTTTDKPKIEGILSKAKPVEDISALLPPGYKTLRSTTIKPKGLENLLTDAKPVDISAFLPPGYKAKPSQKLEILPSLLPPGYKQGGADAPKESTSTTTSITTTAKPAGGFKIVFPSRPGGGTRKSSNRLTTAKGLNNEDNRVTAPTIQKGWPSRATTEFTGWPTPSTTPISIEKLLEAARTASTSSTASSDTVPTLSTTTTTTTTTTTPKPTTPGVCIDECDLAGTIKLVGGAKWVPELLDRNTKEWQILANEVQLQLDNVFSRSSILNKWYKKIRIDGFSEGSVLVDYLVEINDLGRQIDTIEIKKLFHDSLDDVLQNSSSNREGKSLNETTKLEGKLSLGNFIVDPKYTDFIVLPKQVYPTVGYAEDNVLLPQWAIAVIVIGLASLLFVIIFGVTVLVNRQKNSKKKAPTPLTEDMLNELNKNHMGGFDNYGAEDLYNMEDVWNDRGYESKPPKKRSSGSIHDNSMSNLYDSWRSEWNGYYYNAYYGNNPGSSHGGYGRRRSDYDTNF